MNTTQDGARKLPIGWTSKQLSELLNADQLQAVSDILNTHPEPMLALPTLRAYLDGYRQPLLEKGVVSDYLAYAIVWQAIERNGDVP